MSSGEAWAVQCKAHSTRTGERCKRWAITGGVVCPTHGGSSPQVMKAAQERIRAAIPTALDVLVSIMTDPNAKEASRVRAADSILDRGGLKAIDVSVQVDPAHANERLDALIEGALASRQHTEPHTEVPEGQ